MPPLRHENDLRPAETVAKLLDATGDRVTSVIPSGYESYVRILNPIELRDGSAVSWTDVVSRNGVEPWAWMQWPEFAATKGVVLPDGYWREPDMGNPPVSLAKRLVKALDPDQSNHYFASWAGYAMEIHEPTVTFSPYEREIGALLRKFDRCASRSALADHANWACANVLVASRSSLVRRSGHLRAKRPRRMRPEHSENDPRGAQS